MIEIKIRLKEDWTLFQIWLFFGFTPKVICVSKGKVHEKKVKKTNEC